MGALVELHYRAGNRAHGSAWRGARESGGDGDADPDLSDIARAESDESILVGTDEHPFWSVDRNEWVLMGKLRVGERLSLADGSFATVTSINFELSPRTTGRWKASSTGSGSGNQPCTGTLGTPADPQTGLFPVYNLIVADWRGGSGVFRGVGTLFGGMATLVEGAVLFPLQMVNWAMGGEAPTLFKMATGIGQRFDQFYDAQQNAGMGGAAGFFAALNVAGDMIGVSGIIGGAVRQDSATGAPLSSAEGNAQTIVGTFSLATTFIGASTLQRSPSALHPSPSILTAVLRNSH